MLSLSLIFASIAVIGSLLGIGGIAHMASALAQLMFVGTLMIAFGVLITRRGHKFLM